MVLYRLERMRRSVLYSSYLHPEALADLMDRFFNFASQHQLIGTIRYKLEMSLAEQDWFTALRWGNICDVCLIPRELWYLF